MIRKLKHWAKVLWASPGQDCHVSANDEGIICINEQGARSQMTWAELAAIRVIPIQSRPGADLLLWTLSTDKKSLTFPEDARGAQEVIRRLVCLPYFDTLRYRHADESAAQEGVVVWRATGLL